MTFKTKIQVDEWGDWVLNPFEDATKAGVELPDWWKSGIEVEITVNQDVIIVAKAKETDNA